MCPIAAAQNLIPVCMPCMLQQGRAPRAPELAALGHGQLAGRGAGAGHVRGAARPEAHALQPRLEPPLLAEQQHRGAAGRRRRAALLYSPHGDRQLRVVRQVSVLRANELRFAPPPSMVCSLKS